MIKIAVNRRALELNKRIQDTSLHHPPILCKDELGQLTEWYEFRLQKYKWRIVYEPDAPWIEIIDGEPMAFTVWIESYD